MIDGQLVVDFIAVATVDGHPQVLGAAYEHIGPHVELADEEFLVFALGVEELARGEDGDGTALDLGMPLFGVVEILGVAESILVSAKVGNEVEVGTVEGGAFEGEDVGKLKLVAIPEGLAVADKHTAVVALAEGLEEIASVLVGLDAVEVGIGENDTIFDEVAGGVVGDFGGVVDVQIEDDVVGLEAQAHDGLVPLGEEGMSVAEEVVGTMPVYF